MVNLDEIKRNAIDGESSFRSGWKELKDAGYVSKQSIRDEVTKKILKWETIIKEIPDEEKSHNVGNHNVESHQVGNHQVDNRKLQSTEVLSTDIQSTNKSTSRSKLKFETHHLKLAELLYKQIQNNSPNHKEPDLEKWANEFRLIMERDEREGKEIQDLIIKTQKDDFWKKNILSPSKLRKHYDRLVIEFEDDNNFGTGNNIKTKNNTFDYLNEL